MVTRTGCLSGGLLSIRNSRGGWDLRRAQLIDLPQQFFNAVADLLPLRLQGFHFIGKTGRRSFRIGGVFLRGLFLV